MSDVRGWMSGLRGVSGLRGKGLSGLRGVSGLSGEADHPPPT